MSNKSEQIRKLIAKGEKPNAIAKKLKVKPGYVYQIRWQDSKKKKPFKMSGLTLDGAIDMASQWLADLRQAKEVMKDMEKHSG
jgi:hypothetical protein